MSLRFEVGWDRRASTGDSEHWLALTFRGVQRMDGPASFAILVDTSTSMLGGRISHARAAVASLIRACGPADQLAVFAFGSGVTRLLETPGGVDIATGLSTLTAAGKTRLDLAIGAAEIWLRGRAGPRHIVLLTDGDPTDAEGRRASVEPILSQARALGSTGVRTSTIGIGSADAYDSGFLRSLADAGGGPSAVGVEPTALVDRLLSDLRGAGAGEVDLCVELETDVLELREAWRVAPRVQPLTVLGRRVAFAAKDGAATIFRLRYRAPLAAGRGPLGVGMLRVRPSDGVEVAASLELSLVAPQSPELTALDAAVDLLRVRVELARTAQLRATVEDPEDQLRHTRRLSELVHAAGDPRATARIGDELLRLSHGDVLQRGEREAMVDLFRNGGRDA